MNKQKVMELFDRCNRILKRNFDKEFSTMNLSSMQAAVIQYILIESQKRDIFMKDIEEYLGVRGSSATSLLHTMEKEGYIVRILSTQDGRYKKIQLTDKSLLIAHDLNTRILGYIDKAFEGVNEQDMIIFQNVLNQILENIQ